MVVCINIKVLAVRHLAKSVRSNITNTKTLRTMGTMSYLIKFKTQLRGSHYNISLYRNLVLPFIPTVGMLIKDGDWRCTCDEIVWDNKDESFIIYQAGDSDHTRDQKTAEFEAQEYYVANGWVLEQ
jgi:hypothetical protein